MTGVALVVAATAGSAVWVTAARGADRAAVRRRLPVASMPARRRRWRARLAGRRVWVALSLAALPLAPVPAAAVFAAVTVTPLIRARRRAAGGDDLAVAALPEAIDLLAVAARAGLPAPSALAAVTERAPPPWGATFASVLARAGRGERFVDALDELVAGVGEPGHPLRSVLRAAADGDVDLVVGLDRIGADARDSRRRRAEEAARRVPVRLLLPLVACSLPAFALLSIVPIVAGALRALDL